jgi:hypothetical protein
MAVKSWIDSGLAFQRIAIDLAGWAVWRFYLGFYTIGQIGILQAAKYLLAGKGIIHIIIKNDTQVR